MADIRPFKAVRPKNGLEKWIAALPYDVYSRKEASEKVKGDDLSFLRIDRAETQLDDSVDTYDDRVYEKARELFEEMLRSAALDAHVSLRRIEYRQQSPDHPVLYNVPETEYLKFYLFQVV